MSDPTQRFADPARPMRIHLLGVAGSGMSGLAALLLEMGHRVSGSDRVTSGETERLQRLGLDFSSPHSAEAVADAEVVVYSSAIKADNPALAAAGERGIDCLRRAECLAAIMASRKGVVVAGTHGKTTTSAMCAHVLKKGGRLISHYVGAEIPVLGANAHWEAAGEYMVAEGDESDGTLELYHPSHTIVLNIEEEHLDFYDGIESIKRVFSRLLDQTSERIIYCAEDETAAALCASRQHAVSYGWRGADYMAVEVSEGRGSAAFTVMRRGKALGRVELGVSGRHNILNALAAVVLADDLGVSFDLVVRSLGSFAGAKRRFESVYLSPRFRIVDDYGHHPTEIAATLQTARLLHPKRLVVLFQPHRYTRTQRLAEDFGRALQGADLVMVTDVYPAGEAPIEGVGPELIVNAVACYGDTPCRLHRDLTSAHHELGNALEPGDLVLTLGAGNVHEAGRKLARDLAVMEALREFISTDEGDCELYEPMRRHTTMLVGGPAQYWVEPHRFEAFAKCVAFFKERGIPVRVIGRGSNLLVREGGIRGAVIHPAKGEFGMVRVEGDCVVAGAGVRFKKLASVAQAAGLGGFEWMEGIPGNVGGGLRMNAGAMGTATFDQVVRVTFLDEDGTIRTRDREGIEAFYRNVPELQRNYALEATFRGVRAGSASVLERMNAFKSMRRSAQPLMASAGCIFKNPQSIAAGRLIEELGFKGHSVGNAEVSEVHGNFIVNRGKARAADILELINRIKIKARNERSIELETEVQILGEDEVCF